jgi:3-oxoadipate enol-lactonase
MEGSGSNVVFLHGLGDNSQMWWNQTAAFGKDYRWWTIDLRGSGKTDRPKGDYTADVMAADILEWLKSAKIQLIQDPEALGHAEIQQLSLPPVVVGYSMGGRIALQYATTYPSRCRALVMVSSGITANKPTPESQKRRDDMAALLQKGDMKKAAEMMTEGAFSAGFKQKNQKAYDQYLKIKQQQKADGVLAQLLGMEKSGTPDLSKLTCPVLFIAGQNDPGFTPDMAKQAQTAIPNSKLVVLPTGHASPIEAPEQLNTAIMQFIGTLTPEKGEPTIQDIMRLKG